MKKVIIGVVLGLAAVLCMAAMRAQFGSELATHYFQWVLPQGTRAWLAAGDEPTALAVDERTYKTILAAITADASGDGKIAIYEVPYGTNALRIRVLGTVDNATVTFDILSGTWNGAVADSAMVLRGTLACTVGTQEVHYSLFPGATYEFCDTMTLTAATDAASTANWTIANPGDTSETCAEAMLDLQGDNQLVFVPTTINGANFILYVKPY